MIESIPTNVVAESKVKTRPIREVTQENFSGTLKPGVVAYYRVSRTTQTLEPQRLELQAYAQSKGFAIEKEYEDVISGAKVTRDGLNALMADVRAGKVKAVMVVKIDRIARSMSHFSLLMDELRKHKVAFIVPGQGIDTSNDNPVGKLLLNLLGILADFERSLIQERTKAGLEFARAEGRVGGRRPGYGLNLPLDRCLEATSRLPVRLAAAELGVGVGALRYALRRAAASR